jgi:integrase
MCARTQTTQFHSRPHNVGCRDRCSPYRTKSQDRIAAGCELHNPRRNTTLAADEAIAWTKSARWLEWACLKEPGKLVVWTDKRDTRVDLTVDDDLARGLAAIPANSNKVCFPEQDAINRSTKRSKFSVQFGRILQAVGIRGHSFHDLRHTFCSDCQRKGIPTPHIAKLVGHSNEATTKTYLH